MAELFKVLAGTSSDTFSIGGASFMAAPLTIMEYGQFLALPDNDYVAKCAFYAEKLRPRLRGTKPDPATITAEWIMENLPASMIPVLDFLLIQGRMPETGEKKAGG